MTDKASSFWTSLGSSSLDSDNSAVAGVCRAAPSEAWRESVFNSEERLAASRSTTRCPIDIGWNSKRTMVSGQHERTACLLADHLWRVGLISRWKPQPFCLSEIGGPAGISDVLIELRLTGKPLYLIEVKAARFLTKEVEATYKMRQEFATPKGFGFHVWTNSDVLGGQTPHTLNALERGRRNLPTQEVLKKIAESAKGCQTLGPLLAEFGWDDVTAAAGMLKFFFDVTTKLDERTQISRHQDPSFYHHLFAGPSSATSWWDSLEKVEPQNQVEGGL